ncbi:MAG: DoxX family protein [Bacteroidales bacterium]|nr:DoxX family protein [Bacteroidales bacterium]
MKGSARFCRLIVGLVLIFSGFVKLLAPVGTSLVIKEYLEAFSLGFIAPASLVLGITLATLEFLTGTALLLRLRIRIFAWVAFLLFAIFTPLTLYLAVFNPISDCGCFGEAIHLTNWQTFFKNLILLPLALIIFIFRKKISEFRYPVWEWLFTILFLALALYIPIRTLTKAPLQEYTPYRAGSEVTAGVKADAVPEFETEFIYEKNGIRQTFDLENIPDSTWTYVETVTKQISAGGANASDADFVIESPDGQEITEEILSRRNLLLMTIFHPDKFLKRHGVEAITKIRDKALEQGMDFMVVSPAEIAGLPEECENARADLKLLMTFNRSNGGLTWLDDCFIVRKWAYPAAASPKIVFNPSGSSEMEAISTLNRNRMELESIIVAFILLCIVKFIVFFRKKE